MLISNTRHHLAFQVLTVYVYNSFKRMHTTVEYEDCGGRVLSVLQLSQRYCVTVS